MDAKNRLTMRLSGVRRATAALHCWRSSVSVLNYAEGVREFQPGVGAQRQPRDQNSKYIEP